MSTRDYIREDTDTEGGQTRLLLRLGLGLLALFRAKKKPPAAAPPDLPRVPRREDP